MLQESCLGYFAILSRQIIYAVRADEIVEHLARESELEAHPDGVVTCNRFPA